jgi:voltage-gated potassium channel Kch
MGVIHRRDAELRSAAHDDSSARERRELASSAALVLGFLVSIVLGYLGWGQVRPHDFAGAAHFLNRIYLTLQLFVLHPEKLPRHFPWQLQIARFSAPGVLAIATVTVIVAALSQPLQRARLKRLSGHVIICGAGVHGTQLARNLTRDRPDVRWWQRGPLRPGPRVLVVDIDESAPGVQGSPRAGELRLIADTVRADTLRTAGVRKAALLIAVTGDDIVNCQIASAALKRHAGKPELRVLVQAEDPTLARFLEDWDAEDGEDQDDVLAAVKTKGATVEIFGANAIAASALLVDRSGGEAILDRIEYCNDPHLLLAGDHPLLEAVVVAALRRWRTRLLREPDRSPAVLRVSVIGPQAQELVTAITQRWRPEPTLLELNATDVDPHKEESILASRWLREWRSASHAIVACEREVDSVAFAIALSRALGGGVALRRVRTQPSSELDRQLEDQTARSGYLATIIVYPIAELAWGLDEQRIKGISPRERLVATLRDDERYRHRAEEMADAALSVRWLGLHSDGAPRVTPPTGTLAQALLKSASPRIDDTTTVPVSALVGAGLTVNLESRANLRHAAAQLSRDRRSHDAFLAWCEFARKLSDDPRSEQWLKRLAQETGEGRTILRLRAASLGARSDLEGLSPDPGLCRDIGAHAGGQVAIFAGGAASMSSETKVEMTQLLQRALQHYGGLVLTGGTDMGLCGAVHAAACACDVPVVGYAPAGRGVSSMRLRETHASSENSESEPLAMWTDILCAGMAAAEVRLVACPGGRITTAEILLARALGAKVAWLDPRGDLPGSLEDTLPLGAEGVLELPADAMTLRAFLGWPEPEHKLDASLRETVARHLHKRYRDEHRRLHSPEDPALAPWERLAPILRHSNLKAVDDIPNKLQVVGKRLVKDGARLHLRPDQVELLAEMEHGRFNYERLDAGWQLGWRREVSSSLSPYLEPWSELEDAVKEWDRDAVRTIDPALQEAGWGVADV